MANTAKAYILIDYDPKLRPVAVPLAVFRTAVADGRQRPRQRSCSVRQPALAMDSAR